MKIGIIVAMDKELRQLQQLFCDGNIRVEKCGIGKVNAALGAQRMINEFHPDIIISSGCAGGNGDDINIQDVIVGSEVTYHDVYCGKAIDDTTVYGQVQGLPVRYTPDPMLLEKALAISHQPSAISVHPGLIVTGDWFVDSKEKMSSIVEIFPEAKAVDMESSRPVISTRCRLSLSVSSATSPCVTQMPLSIMTSGTPSLITRSKSLRLSSNHYKSPITIWKSYRVSPSTIPT